VKSCRRWIVLVMWGAAATLGAPHPLRAGGLDRTELADLFSQGKDCFRRANELAAKDPLAARDLYRKAVIRFERIAREGGVWNGRLFYNIGNIYFRLGDIGHAILSYRRAAALIQDDPNLHQNLTTARARTIDKIEPKERTKVLKTLFFWHYDLSPRTRLTLFSVFFGAVWAALTIRLFKPKAAPRFGLLLAAVLAAALFGSLLVDTVAASRRPAGVVLDREIVARKGDAETYHPSFTAPLHAGAEFELIEDRGEWLHVELADGRRCWVPARAVGIVNRLEASPTP
jgi:tetratricopeptide (TPR) repeat protein